MPRWRAFAALLVFWALAPMLVYSKATSAPLALSPASPSASSGCTLRLGLVYSKTGPIASSQARDAYLTAITKVNRGDWASGQRAPGIALGKGLSACQFELVEADDQSNTTLHQIQVAQLIPQVDFFLLGNPFVSFVRNGALEVMQAEMLSIACCVTPESVFTLVPNQQYLFGLARPDVTITQPLLHYLNLAPVVPRLAVVYSISETSNIEACMSVYALKGDLNVVLNYTVTTGDGTLSAVPQLIQAMQATFVFACLEFTDSMTLSTLLDRIHPDGVFYLRGPSFSQFDALPSALYSFTGMQWALELPFTDVLLGNSTAFQDDMATYAQYTAEVTDVAALAAVSIEVLVHGLMQGTKAQTSGNVAKVIAASKPAIAAAMQAFSESTLIGAVQFDSAHRNVAGSNVIAQFLPGSAPSSVVKSNASTLALVFPYDYSTRLAVYPAPQITCTVLLGLVYSATGLAANSEALYGYELAIARINSGRWEGSGYIDSGFDLGTAMRNCTYTLVTADDESSAELHANLTLFMAQQVDIMLSGATGNDATAADQVLLNATSKLAIMCCDPALVPASSMSPIFSVYRRDDDGLDSLADFLLPLYPSVGPVVVPLGANIGLIYASDDTHAMQQCISLRDYTSGGKSLSITFEQVVTASGDGSIDATTMQALVDNRVRVLIACLALNDSIVLARLVAAYPLNAFYLTTGPGDPVFEAAANGSAYMLTSAQWLPTFSLDQFGDQLFGDSGVFSDDLAALDSQAKPTAPMVAAAMAMEVLHHGVLEGLSLASLSSPALAIAGRTLSIAHALLAPQTPMQTSLMGAISFDPVLHTNGASTLFIAQSQPQPPLFTETELLPVLPVTSYYTPEASLIYPAPNSAERSCTIRLGLVYSATGALAQGDAFYGYSLAVNKINAGDWAVAGYGTPNGFNLGRSLVRCRYELLTADDESRADLHLSLVTTMASSVDFLLSGDRGNGSATADVNVANATGVFTIVSDAPGLLYGNLQPEAMVFGMAMPVVTATNELLRYLSFNYPLPQLAVIYSVQWLAAVQACTNAITAAGTYGIPVSIVHTMLSYDGSLPDFVASNLTNSGATFLLLCLEDTDAAEAIKLTRSFGYTGTYTLTGPHDTAFNAAAVDDSYVFTTDQWHPSLPFTDDLFGDATQFQSDLAKYEKQTGVPLPTTCLAAVGVELLHRSILAATVDELITDASVLLNANRNKIAEAMRNTLWTTLMGLVDFQPTLLQNASKAACENTTACPENQNLGESVYTTQVVPGSAVVNMVFPSALASANPIYPAPTQDYCVKLLSVPTSLDYNDPAVQRNVSATCKAWEDTMRTSLSPAVFENNTAQFTCVTCASLYNISACYGINGVRDVTLYPYIKHSTCGQNTTELACSALLANTTERLTIPCDYTPWYSAAGIFAAVFLCVCFAINVAFAVVVMWKRNAKAIRFAQFPLLIAFIIGACMMCAFGLVFIGPATDAACQLRTWLFNLSVTVTICPLFLKAYRVWRIFENPKLKHLVITTTFLLKVLAAVLLAEIVWLAIWTGVSPTQSTCLPQYYAQLLTPVPTYVCANTMSWFAIVAAVLIGIYILVTVVLAMLTLSVSTMFAEKEVLFASVNIAIVGGIVAFLFFFTNLSQQALTALVAVGLGWCSTFSVGVLVGPKLYWIFVKGEAWTDAVAFNKDTPPDTDAFNKLKDKQQMVADENMRLREENAVLKGRINELVPGSYAPEVIKRTSNASMNSSGGQDGSARNRVSWGGTGFARQHSSDGHQMLKTGNGDYVNNNNNKAHEVKQTMNDVKTGDVGLV